MIYSLLDTDLYKLTMQQAILKLYPDIEVEYIFKNRGNHIIGNHLLKILQNEVKKLSKVTLSDEEKNFLRSLNLFSEEYIIYLCNFSFDPNQLVFDLDSNNQMTLKIKGSWKDAILWEVPLMALISEIYFKNFETDWINEQYDFYDKTISKRETLTYNKVLHADFGTRRRRSFSIQDDVINILEKSPYFVGTSNVHFAMKYGLKPIGTMAHEWIMGISALSSLRYANRSALYKWQKVYEGDLGIALTDTFGTNAFFRDFDKFLSKLYDGVRHDSGCPFEFGEKVIKHYEKYKIDPKSKNIIFSDGLNVEKAVELKKYFSNKIKVSFGIGTNFTSDFETNKPLNMVIKLYNVDNVHVVKLSEELGKEIGEKDALKVAKWVFRKTNKKEKQKGF